MVSSPLFSLQGRKVWVAGHAGMAGGAISRRLQREDCEVLSIDRASLDLRRQSEVEDWMTANRPDVVFIAAATVGGILANSTRPAEFLYDNLAIETNIIHGAWRAGVSKLLFLGSSCVYPRLAPQPVAEEQLLAGPLEPTNEWYAVAKIAGIKMCQAYRRQYGCDFLAVLPTGLYGLGDRYDLTQGHVIPALIMKIHAAKMENLPSVELWGSGSPIREFLYSEDLGDALIFLINHYSDEAIINVASGNEVSIRQLAEAIAEVVGYRGDFVFDTSKPDGMPRKVMDDSKLSALGWRASTPFKDGLTVAYGDYLARIVG